MLYVLIMAYVSVGCVSFLAIVKNVAMNTHIHIFV